MVGGCCVVSAGRSIRFYVGSLLFMAKRIWSVVGGASREMGNMVVRRACHSPLSARAQLCKVMAPLQSTTPLSAMQPNYAFERTVIRRLAAPRAQRQYAPTALVLVRRAAAQRSC